MHQWPKLSTIAKRDPRRSVENRQHQPDPTGQRSVMLRITGTIANSWRGDLAIDQLNITAQGSSNNGGGPCPALTLTLTASSLVRKSG